MFMTRKEYRDAWDRAYKEDTPIPLNVDIELASICNLACPFCFWGEADFNKEMSQKAADGKMKKRFMPFDIAQAIIVEAGMLGVPALKFNWRGESTMHPGYSELLKMARELRDAKIGRGVFFDLLVNTNANCKDEAIPGLMAATKVMVSLDSMVPETYKKMRVNGNLERAKEVIRELLRRGHPNVWVRRVITKDNAHEKFARDVRNLFGAYVHVSEHACFDRNADEHHQLNDPKFERTYCGYPSQRIMIASDGTAFPCCVDYDGTMPMGKFPDQSIAEIWRGQPFQFLRDQLRANITVSKTCANCTSWMAYKAPERDQVQDKDVIA